MLSQAQSDSGDTEDQPEKPIEWHSGIEIKDSSDERLVGAFIRMEALADEFTMTVKTRFRAAELISEAWEQRFMHGRGENTTVAACLYIACRKLGQPIPINKVADATDVSTSKLKSVYRTLVTELNLQVDVAEPADYIPHLSVQLGLDHNAVKRAKVELAKVDTVPGNPVGIAAAALYLAANTTEHAITFRETAEAAGMTKETIWRKTERFRCS